ncbi:hypothetical protein V5F79_22085 [Xanthobacter flavus]|uniref:hypothetical protein n=1 Tax=Xanthobacter flavus TaxID=281 RepID=UPI003729A88F
MMQIAGFEFADGARFQTGAAGDANLVGQHLELLRQQCKGELTPKDVVDDARNPNSPLHCYFEWDDSAAAEHYRLSQARGLIRAVVAIYTQPDQPAQRMKAYVHIPEPAAPHYRETSQAMSQKKTRDMVLQRAWREFQDWRRRYKDLKEFAAVFEAADDVAKKLPKKGGA